MKTIIYTQSAAKDFDKLPAQVQEAVERALSEYAIYGTGDVKYLIDRLGSRLRIGRYRVIFDEDQVTVLAFYIGKRDTGTYRRN